MGWTSTYKPKGEPLKEFFADSFRYSSDSDAGLIDLATHGRGLAYAAVRHPRGFVFAVVIQIKYHRGYHNITYREDDETSGPVHATCPKRILDLLTPDQEMIDQHDHKPNGYWREWRERCRAYLAAKDTRPKVKDGDIIRFEHALAFTNGDKADTFVVRRDKTFRGGTCTPFHGTIQDAKGHIREGYGRYLITRWHERPHRVIGHAPRAKA